jgi:hypothetical protein
LVLELCDKDNDFLETSHNPKDARISARAVFGEKRVGKKSELFYDC